MSELTEFLPSSAEAEGAVIGALLNWPTEVFGKLDERSVTAEHFHFPENRAIYEESEKLRQAGKAISLTTVTQSARDNHTLGDCGGAAGIAEAFTRVEHSYGLADHIEILVDKFTLRQMIAICSGAKNRGMTDQTAPLEILQECVQALTEVVTGTQKKKRRTFHDAIRAKIERMQTDSADEDAIKTGFIGIDRNSPLKLGHMPLVTGERKAGKSMFALNIAANIAADGHALIYFTLEEPESDLVDRLFARASSIPIGRHHQKYLNQSAGDWDKMSKATRELSKSKITICDDIFDLAGICAEIRRWKSENPDGVLAVIDYAQLVRVPAKKGSNREQEVAIISRTIRLLSMELKIAIMLLCQLNAQGETRESKALEQDCTAMWKVAKTGKEDEDNTKRLILIPFQRNGDSNIAFPVTFQGHISNFENCALDER